MMKQTAFSRSGAVQKLLFTVVALALTLLAARPASAGDFTITNASASSSLWAATNLYDNNTLTCWSSNTHASAGYTEWIAYWWSGMQITNYVKLLPRYSGSNALCFPTAFTVYYSDGSSWVQVASYTSYPTPHRADLIILPLPGNYSANGIHIVATTLSNDGTGNYAFQLAEAKAGYDAGFNSFRFSLNNSALTNRTQISGSVTANSFNPNKMAQWNYDDRGIIIAANPGGYWHDIYSPQAICLGGNLWRIYFHGWDGNQQSDTYDRIYTTVTYDNFLTFDTHYMILDHGAYQAVGNESVVYGPYGWRMAYTCLRSDMLNKTGYATSTDGCNWTPNAGSASYMFNVTGYANWAAGDFNGVNPIIRDSGGTWHYYFMDSRYNTGTEHATGTDGVNFVYQGKAQTSVMAMQDVKSFTYNNTTYYAACYYWGNVFYTCGTSLSSLGTPITAFSPYGSGDKYIATCGWVQDGSKILGILYGGCPTSDLMALEIYARWLQKKVVFQNSYVTWNVNNGFGPTNVRMYMTSGDAIETGNFYVYDTDGTTLLYTSPQVTLREGDVWNYSGS